MPILFLFAPGSTEEDGEYKNLYVCLRVGMVLLTPTWDPKGLGNQHPPPPAWLIPGVFVCSLSPRLWRLFQGSLHCWLLVVKASQAQVKAECQAERRLQRVLFCEHISEWIPGCHSHLTQMTGGPGGDAEHSKPAWATEWSVSSKSNNNNNKLKRKVPEIVTLWFNYNAEHLKVPCALHRVKSATHVASSARSSFELRSSSQRGHTHSLRGNVMLIEEAVWTKL